MAAGLSRPERAGTEAAAAAAATGLDTAHYVVLLPSVERCLDRVATRVGHGFADAPATRKMHAEFAAAGLRHRNRGRSQMW